MATKILRRGGVLGCAVFALLGLSSLAHSTIVSYHETFNDGSTKSAHMALMSANGVDMYVPQIHDLAIAHYQWNAAQQKLAFTSIYQEGSMSDGKTMVGLVNPWQVMLSPDQRHLYVISHDTGTNPLDTNKLALFERDTANGELVFEAAYANNMGGITGIAAPTAMTLSPDGRSLYVVSATEQVLTIFHIDGDTGQLVFMDSLKHGTKPDGLVEPSAVIVTPDGRFVYVTDAGSNLVAIYAHDAVTDALTLKSTFTLDGLPSNMIASRDGAFLYILLADKNGVATIARDVIGGTLKLVATVFNGTQNMTALMDPYALTLSPDDTKLIVGARANNSLVVFRRQPVTGLLTFIEEHVAPELKGVFGNVFTPQGSHLMTVGTEPSIGIYTVDQLAQDDIAFVVRDPSSTETQEIDVLKNDIGTASDASLTIISFDPTTAHGAVIEKVNEKLTYRPTTNYTGIDTFNYRMRNAAGRTDFASVTVYVDTPPVAMDDHASVAAGGSITISVLANDTDVNFAIPGFNDELRVIAVEFSSNQGGTITIVDSGQSVTYTAPISYTGEDVFTYTIDDGKGGRATATVFINVTTGTVTPLQPVPDIAIVEKKHKNGGSLDMFALLSLLLAFAPRVLCRRK
ncbi:MAG: beta-propeller fold lactonase family protein [Gammaproteobacteria bacterium]|nr:beta-propeller fold lactonase family protein [Gammaproteobacteria bacterium]